jgi:raffinose/stachyose/melibiose transport system permease protein
MTDIKRATAAAGTPAAAVAPQPERPERPERPEQTKPRSRFLSSLLRFLRSHRKFIELVVLLGPPLVLFAAFVLVPILISAYYGLFNWTGYGPVSGFDGLHNYKIALDNPLFRQSLVHNLIIALLSLVIQLPISIGIALLLNRRMRGASFLRVAVFAPYVVSQATTAVLWLLLLEPEGLNGRGGGLVDVLMKEVGVGSLVHPWLADPTLVLYTMFVVLTWQFIGFGIILLLAGLQGIPHELHEAASIDGASSWQATRHITLPLLGPTIRIWIFLSMIGSLQVFDLVWIMTLGGPANGSQTMVSYMIFYGFRSQEYGYGSAVAVILFIISFAFAYLYQRFALRRDTEGALTRAVQ